MLLNCLLVIKSFIKDIFHCNFDINGFILRSLNIILWLSILLKIISNLLLIQNVEMLKRLFNLLFWCFFILIDIYDVAYQNILWIFLNFRTHILISQFLPHFTANIYLFADLVTKSLLNFERIVICSRIVWIRLIVKNEWIFGCLLNIY